MFLQLNLESGEYKRMLNVKEVQKVDKKEWFLDLVKLERRNVFGLRELKLESKQFEKNVFLKNNLELSDDSLFKY